MAKSAILSVMVSKHFFQRITFGSLITAFAFVLVYFSYYPYVWIPFLAVIGALAFLCLREYFNILKAIKIYPEKTLLMGLSLLYILLLAALPSQPWISLLPLIFILATLVLTFVMLIVKNSISIVAVAATLLGMVWITIPLATTYKVNYFFPVTHAEHGQYWLLYILFVTKVCDMLAYFVGSKWGKHPLAPSISPKKTVEGAIGGLIGAVATSCIFYAFHVIHIDLLEAVALGVVLALLTGIGDLAESILKRDAGFKDSSQIPGLGGFFDIMDSLLFTSPFIYFYLILRWPLG